jgi:hypothetical protein
LLDPLNHLGRVEQPPPEVSGLLVGIQPLRESFLIHPISSSNRLEVRRQIPAAIIQPGIDVVTVILALDAWMLPEIRLGRPMGSFGMSEPLRDLAWCVGREEVKSVDVHIVSFRWALLPLPIQPKISGRW